MNNRRTASKTIVFRRRSWCSYPFGIIYSYILERIAALPVRIDIAHTNLYAQRNSPRDESY